MASYSSPLPLLLSVAAPTVTVRRIDPRLDRERLVRLPALSPAERSRILAFRNPDDAVASLTARTLMIELTATALRCRESDVRIDREPSGRPFVSAPATGLDVNASHAGEWVA